LRLLYQTHSPYARKVLVFVHEAGLANRIDVVHHETSPLVKNAEVFAANPLGKVPVLLRPRLLALFDSDVICAYLDGLAVAGGRLIPSEGETRWHVLRMQAVAQGIAEAGIALRWETVRRPETLRYLPLREGFATKLDESYAWLDRELDSDGVHLGHIAMATALDWIEFRDLPSFRSHKRVSAWFDAFRRRPSMMATPLSGDTHDTRPRTEELGSG
jgi:glutathione S-transferase